MFGRITERAVQPGMHWNFPAPMGRQVIIRTATQLTAPVGYSTGPRPLLLANQRAPDLWMTGGGSVIRVRLDVLYTISDLADYLTATENPTVVLSEAGERILTRFLVIKTVDQVLTNERQLMRQTVQTELQELVDKMKLGIQVRSVDMVEMAPPVEGEVDIAFQEVQSSRSDSERTIQNALAQKSQIVSAAQARAQELRNQSLSTKHGRISLAQGQTERFLSVAKEHALAPANTEQRIYFEKMEKLLPNVKVYVVDPPANGQVNMRVLQ